MALIHLVHDRLRVSIDAAVGAGIADFSVQGPAKFWYPLMRRGAPGETVPSLLGSFLMAPWCNRTAGAAFAFGGRQRSLRANTPDGHAQHGDVRARAFTVLDRSPISARFEFDSRSLDAAPDSPQGPNWPWAYVVRQRFELGPRLLAVEISVTNASNEPMPAGCGLHPYFPRRLWDDGDQLHVKAPVRGRYPTTRAIPTGAPVRDALCERLCAGGALPDTPVDDVFLAEPGQGAGARADLHWSRSNVTLSMTASPVMGHLVVFCPHAESGKPTPLPYVAVEPQSQVNNALNLAETPGIVPGTVTLEPGATLTATTSFAVTLP